jgi:hypothetical protein
MITWHSFHIQEYRYMLSNSELKRDNLIDLCICLCTFIIIVIYNKHCWHVRGRQSHSRVSERKHFKKSRTNQEENAITLTLRSILGKQVMRMDYGRKWSEIVPRRDRLAQKKRLTRAITLNVVLWNNNKEGWWMVRPSMVANSGLW